MQPRLMRSRTEVIVAGVCGGLGEYFGLDPVIVRLIFVLVSLTTGLGFIVYPILWLVMPKAPVTMQRPQQHAYTQQNQQWHQQINEFGQEVAQFGQEMAEAGQQFGRQMREAFGNDPRSATKTAAPPPPEAYNFDPMTGERIQRPANEGQTVHLNFDQNPANLSAYQQPTPTAAPKQRARSIGIVLVAFGIIVLASELQIASIIFPLMMIGAGIFLLKRRKN